MSDNGWNQSFYKIGFGSFKSQKIFIQQVKYEWMMNRRKAMGKIEEIQVRVKVEGS